MSFDFRVLTCEFAHETNTFSIVPTTIDNFKRQVYLITKDEIIKNKKNTKTCLGATFESAKLYNWDLIQTVSATANPTGKITTDTFETIVGLILKPLNELQFDGIVLHLHGAMVTQLHDDAEGEILKRIRNIIGNDIPVIVTLDLHGNITQLMADNASCLIACRTYPHIDFYERSFQACHLLQKAMKKEIDLHTIIVKRAMMKGLDGGRTQIGCPLRYLIDRSEEIENRIEKEILVISICAGFSASDIYEIGPSVTITVDRNKGNEKVIKNAYDIANEFMDYTWKERMYSSVKHKCIDDAIIYALNSSNNKDIKGPLIMADVTDNPGSGHYGDSTNLLKAMIEANLSNSIFYAIYDPQAVLQAANIGVGKENTIITLGGKHDINAGGKPLILNGKVITLSDGSFPCYGPMGMHVPALGLSMLFRVGNVDICVISNNSQCFDLAQLTSLGSDPTKKNIVALKSNHHFRAHFEPISRDIITVDGGGLGSIILNGGGNNYKNIRRPIWPLDEII